MAVPETTGVKNAGGITRFMRETKVELKKVTWPTKQELIANTAVVLIAVVICAALIWVIDSFFNVVFSLDFAIRLRKEEREASLSLIWNQKNVGM